MAQMTTLNRDVQYQSGTPPTKPIEPKYIIIALILALIGIWGALKAAKVI